MYDIGQVLFIISSGTRKIEPIQVHSKQTLETMDGTTVQHMCATVDNKTISLEKHTEKGLLSGVFDNLDAAEEHLLDLASSMVKKLVLEAKDRSLVFAPKNVDDSASSVEEVQAIEESNHDTVQTIVLEDGTTANVHLPSELT